MPSPNGLGTKLSAVKSGRSMIAAYDGVAADIEFARHADRNRVALAVQDIGLCVRDGTSDGDRARFSLYLAQVAAQDVGRHLRRA